MVLTVPIQVKCNLLYETKHNSNIKYWCITSFVCFMLLDVVCTHYREDRQKLLTYLRSWAFLEELRNCAATQDYPTILWNPKVPYRVHKSPPLFPILSHINPIYIFPSYLSKIFYVPNLIPILFCLGRLSKDSVQVRGFLFTFVTCLFLWWVVSPTPISQTEGPPLVGCPRLLIQYIRS
jgi:hypothetical protein